DGIRDFHVTGVQTCALPIYAGPRCLAAAFPGRHPPAAPPREPASTEPERRIVPSPSPACPSHHPLPSTERRKQGDDSILRKRSIRPPFVTWFVTSFHGTWVQPLGSRRG